MKHFDLHNFVHVKVNRRTDKKVQVELDVFFRIESKEKGYH